MAQGEDIFAGVAHQEGSKKTQPNSTYQFADVRNIKSAEAALQRAFQAAPKALKPDEARFLKSMDPKFLIGLIQKPNGADLFNKYLVSKTGFPPPANITAFFTNFVMQSYKTEIDFGANVAEGAKIKDEKRVGDAMRKYKDEMNNLNRKHGLREITELEVQRNAFEIAKQHMGEMDATDLIGKAARYAKFKPPVQTKQVPMAFVQSILRQLRDIMKKEEEERKRLFKKTIEEWRSKNKEHAGFIDQAMKESKGDIKELIKVFENTNNEVLSRIPKRNGG